MMWPAQWVIAGLADGELDASTLGTFGLGQRLGCVPPTAPGQCLNCGGRDYVYSWVLTATGPRHYFGPGPKDWRHASLESAPCPVCQGGQRDAFLIALSGLESLVLDGKPAVDLRLSDFRPAPGQVDGVEVARRLLSEVPTPRTSALFFGPYGTGKTHLLCCVVNGLRVAGVTATYTTAEGILRSLRRTFSGGNTEAVRRQLEGVQLLVVDELDRVKLTDWAGEALFGILNTRYAAGLPTLCATNKTPSELGESDTYAALVSRLSAGEMVAVTGEDMRPMAQGRLQ